MSLAVFAEQAVKQASGGHCRSLRRTAADFRPVASAIGMQGGLFRTADSVGLISTQTPAEPVIETDIFAAAESEKRQQHDEIGRRPLDAVVRDHEAAGFRQPLVVAMLLQDRACALQAFRRAAHLVVVNFQIEPFVKCGGRRKDVRQHKVQQGPQFVKVVLQRGPVRARVQKE